MGRFYYGSKKISDTQPKCRICGSLIMYHTDKQGTNRLDGCENVDCIAHNPPNRYVKMECIFGKEESIKFEQNWRKKHNIYPEYWMEKGYSEDEAKIKVSEEQKKRNAQNKSPLPRCSKENMLTKLGEEECKLFFKRKSPFCVEYWVERGYSEDEAKLKISEKQKKNSLKSKCDIAKKKKRSWRCVEYWVERGYSEDEAKLKISEKQSKNFSKQICIEKYGEIEGIRIWEERQKRWQKTLHISKNLHGGYSKISQNLFDELLQHYDAIDQNYVFYGSKNNEFSIREDDRNYIFDFTDLKQRKIIEFNGDIYHGNPRYYKSTDIPNPYKKHKTAKDLWEYDKHKENIAIKNGFKVLTIWEDEYREDKNKTINECLQFLL